MNLLVGIYHETFLISMKEETFFQAPARSHLVG